MGASFLRLLAVLNASEPKTRCCAQDGAMSLALRNFGARSASSDPDEAPHSAPTGSRLDPAMGECQVITCVCSHEVAAF